MPTTIRTIRPTDLVSLIAFLRNGSHREVTAQTWPKLWGDGSDWRVIRRFLPRVLIGTGRSQMWVGSGKNGLQGLVIAHPRAGRLAWDAEELFVAEEDRSVAVDLLEHLASEAATHGARRVFLCTSMDSEMARIASRAGFVNYTSESLYSLRLTGTSSAVREIPARPRLRQDTQGIFQLYNASVPCRVRSAEAMTLEEWSSLDRGDRLWAPSLGGNALHFIWERQGMVVGWMKLTLGANSQHLELLVHPDVEEEEGEPLFLSSLTMASYQAPVYVTAREYQPGLVSALEHRGFSRVADYLVFARELTARVRGRVLVPARA